MVRGPHSSTLFPYTTLFRSEVAPGDCIAEAMGRGGGRARRRARPCLAGGRPAILVGSRAIHAACEQDQRDAEARHGVSAGIRSEEHTSELQSRLHLVCRLLL